MKPIMKIDRTSWGRLRVTGGDRVRFLQGLTTINVEKLADGDQAWGAILNPKGRVLSVIDIARLGEAFGVLCEAALADKTRALLERYAVMDDVAFERDRPARRTSVSGATRRVWTRRSSSTARATWPTTDPAVERLRIRAGFLRYGVDVDEDHFPFETPLAPFLDYGKGCYVGQEPVFRVHAQGNAARTLRGLAIEGDAAVAHGTTIKHAAKDNAGIVTSAVAAGDGTTLALGYLHRTAWEVGGTVEIGGHEAHGARAAVVKRPRLLAAPRAGGLQLHHEQLRHERLLRRSVPDPGRDVERRGHRRARSRTASVDPHRACSTCCRRSRVVDPGRGRARRLIVDPARDRDGPRLRTGPLDQPRARFTEPQVLRVHPCDSRRLLGRHRARRRGRSTRSSARTRSPAMRCASICRLGANELFVLARHRGRRSHRGLRVRCRAAARRSAAAARWSSAAPSSRSATAGSRSTPASRRTPTAAHAGRARRRRADRAVDRRSAISMLGETAYARYRESRPTAPDARGAAGRQRAPAVGPRHRQARHDLEPRARRQLDVEPARAVPPGLRAPPAHRRRLRASATTARARTATTFCAVPAVLELTPAGAARRARRPRRRSTLQALRTELRPDQPEVDGILGTDALDSRSSSTSTTRTTARSAAAAIDTACAARPELSSERPPRDRRELPPALPGPITRRVTPASTSPGGAARDDLALLDAAAPDRRAGAPRRPSA